MKYNPPPFFKTLARSSQSTQSRESELDKRTNMLMNLADVVSSPSFSHSSSLPLLGLIHDPPFSLSLWQPSCFLLPKTNTIVRWESQRKSEREREREKDGMSESVWIYCMFSVRPEESRLRAGRRIEPLVMLPPNRFPKKKRKKSKNFLIDFFIKPNRKKNRPIEDYLPFFYEKHKRIHKSGALKESFRLFI